MHDQGQSDKHLRNGQRPSQLRNALESPIAARIERDVPMSGLTTLRIGGPADALCRITNIDDARRFHELSRTWDLPLLCLGGGSNLLIDDLGISGLVFKMEMTEYSVEHETVRIGAGSVFDTMIRKTLESGLTGLEFASGIPGTIGGAIAGNAGCFGHDIGEFLVEATLMKADGQLVVVGPDDLAFSYRHSALKSTDDILLSVLLRLERGDLDAATETRRHNMALRHSKHPVDLPTAGSYFKNLEPTQPGGRRQAAGELLDRVGARDLHSGGAAVFNKHANIIINRDHATCSDVLDLALKMKNLVRERFGILLEEEVRHIPRLPGK